MTERYLAGGGRADLAALALALGAQFTLGHFQIQMWTAGLVLLTGFVRAWQKSAAWSRSLFVPLAVGWAGALASPQLGLSYEMTRIARFDRPAIFLTNYAFPPAHWAQIAIPRLFMDFRGNHTSAYWYNHATSPDEACLYVGTVVLVLAVIGGLVPGDRRLRPWKWLSVLAFILATMPRWFPEGYRLVLMLPGLGLFRAPGRYVLIPSLGLCLLAGRGFDATLKARRFWSGYVLATLIGVAAFAWGWYWSGQPDVLAAIGEEARRFHMVEAAVAWAVALGILAAWRLRPGRWTQVAVLLVAASELAYLYHHGTVPWGWSVDLQATSPVMRRLAEERDVGLVSGALQDVVVRGGHTTAWPNLGIVPPPPNYLLEASADPAKTTKEALALMTRYGVTHGVFDGDQLFRRAEVLYLGPDPGLDAILPPRADKPLPRRYRLERYPPTFPAVRIVTKARVAADWYEIYPALIESVDPEVVWYMKAEALPEPSSPRAANARILSWDGRSGEVETDGWADLVIRRTHYPGWTTRLNAGPEVPVVPADGGIQAIRIPYAGRTRVTMIYRPRHLPQLLAVSLTGLLAAIGVLGSAWRGSRRSSAG